MNTLNYRNVNAPAGQAWCSFCRCYKDRSEFYRNRATAHGLQYICKDHTKEAVCGIRRSTNGIVNTQV